MTFLQQGRDTDFFENYNHSGKRVVAKALSDKEGPSSTWSWRTTPMCDSQIAVVNEVRQSGAGGKTALAVWLTCWYLPRSTRGRHTRAVVGLLQCRSSEELLTWAYVVGGAECQSSWHSWCTPDQCGLARTSGCCMMIWTPKCLWVVTRGIYEPCMKTSDWSRFWVFGAIWRCSLFSALNSMPHDEAQSEA